MILVVGDASWDLFFEIDRFPGPDEKVFTDTMLTNVGGVGVNAAIAARLLGADVGFVGRFGGDAFAETVEAELRDAGLDLSLCRTDPALRTPIAIIMTDPSGEKRIVLAPSPAMSPAADQVSATNVPGVEWVHMVAYDVDAAESIAATLAPVPMSLDLEPPTVPGGDPAAMRGLLARMDTVIVNAQSARLFGGRNETIDTLHGWGVPVVILTLGAEGAVCATATCRRALTPPDAVIVDTTGAGDTFAAAHAVARAGGRSPEAAAEFAVAAATLSCRGLGPRGAFPSLSEIRSLTGDL